MKKKALLLAASVVLCALGAETKNAERFYNDHGTNYYAWFTYDTSELKTTNGQPLYQAVVDLYRIESIRIPVASGMSCVYSKQGTQLDSIEALLGQAVYPQINPPKFMQGVMLSNRMYRMNALAPSATAAVPAVFTSLDMATTNLPVKISDTGWDLLVIDQFHQVWVKGKMVGTITGTGWKPAP
jgi:hypothetical protein